MPAPHAILAVDQGTTSTRAIAFDAAGAPLAAARRPLPQSYPREGWVEHDPERIWSTTVACIAEASAAAAAAGLPVAAVGIANQRETAVVWERGTGRPIHPAVVWQDRRTAEACARLRADGLEEEVARRSGLLLDPYFSATKVAWILDRVEGARARADRGELAFGTVDSFLLWRLTGGRVHATDATNASRTGLFNIVEGAWDPALLGIFRVPEAVLPEVRDTAADFGETEAGACGARLPVLALAGDQQAAAVGQACLAPGDAKATFGTGCFVLLNTGDAPAFSRNRLLATVASRIGGRMSYALEGSVFMAGAVVQWLQEGLGILREPADSERLARSVPDTGGVFLVPAFTGLGAPHWDADARGLVHGITRGTGAAHLARAGLEAVAYQVRDLFRAMEADGIRPAVLRVDGAMAANDWLMGFLAGILGIPVERPRVIETTARGVAFLAALQAGLLPSMDGIAEAWTAARRFDPAMEEGTRKRLLAGWDDAVRRAGSAR